MRGRKPRSGVRMNEAIGVARDPSRVLITRATISGRVATAYRKVDPKKELNLLIGQVVNVIQLFIFSIKSITLLILLHLLFSFKGHI